MNAFRRTWRASGVPLRALLLGGIWLYRATLSGWLGGQCRFYPTCSHYAEDAIRAHGAIGGSARAAWRLLRCNPFGKGGVESAVEGPADDNVIPNLPGRVISPLKYGPLKDGPLKDGARG
jgi:putative membrane protein insertion efficiency factor